MEQEAFEEAIKEFTTKIVDPDNGTVKYVINRKPKVTVYAQGMIKQAKANTSRVNVEFRDKKKPSKKIHTPDGVFVSAGEAADHFAMSPQTVYNRVLSKHDKHKEWYYEE